MRFGSMLRVNGHPRIAMRQRMQLASSLFVTLLISTACGDSANQTVNRDNPLIDSTKIDQTIDDFMQSNPVAGLSVALVRKTAQDTLVWTNEYGMSDIESMSAVNPDTRFRLGSVSKAVMGTVLMIANEKGFFQLDDDVHALLNAEGVFSLNNPQQLPVTVAQLAKHRSGIVDDDEKYACAYFVPTENGEHVKLVNLFDLGMSCPEQSPVSLEGYLAAYLDSDGEFYSASDNFKQSAPGTITEYSNIGAGLAGYLIRAITGQDLATFARQELFQPLEMSAADWRVDTPELDNIATAYVADEGELSALPRYELATWPDGGLRSNAIDLAKLLSLVMNKGVAVDTQTRLLSEASIDTMLPDEGSDFGIFWAREISITIDDEQRSLLGHTGSDPGAFSAMFFDPISETGIAFVGNGDDEEFSATTFRVLVEGLFESAGKLM